MNLNKFDEIDGFEALKRLYQKERLYTKFNSGATCYQIRDDNSVVLVEIPTDQIVTSSSITVGEILRNKWYVKKPFDVRTEMLERPNEWVGAFRDPSGWHKVGFDTDFMLAVATVINSNMTTDLCAEVERACKQEIDRCIPIEDVPAEELK